MSDEKRQQILAKASEIFQKHGFRRVNMKELAESLHISRPGLYLYFKTKEEIFNAVIKEFGARAIREAQAEVSKKKTLKDKLYVAFEIYVIDIFALTLKSPEAKEISDSSFEFARGSLDESYRKFEQLVSTVLKDHKSEIEHLTISFDRCAHLLVSSARGCKTVAKSVPDLRKMIYQLIALTLRFD